MQRYVKVQLGELRLTSLCLSYLSLPGLSGHESRIQLGARISTGYFAFLDYSIGHWIRHLEAGLTDTVDQDEEVLKDLSDCIQTFLDLHFRRPSALTAFQVSQGSLRRLSIFQHRSYYSDLQLAVTSARKQLSFHGDMKSSEILLDLEDIAISTRSILEEAYTREDDCEWKAKFEQMYGTKIYKCPKLSCHAFHDGFLTAKERDMHVNKHNRPFRCNITGCPQEFFGFNTSGDLDKHMKKTHVVQRDEAGVFLEESEILEACDDTDQSNDDKIHAQDSAQETAPPQPQHPATEEHCQVELETAQTSYPCPDCSKVFRRKYNLQAHMVIHNSSRPFSCTHCTLSFARQGDMVRHESSHGPKKFICGGVLKTGEAWGCKKTYARADTLKAHHNTATGKKCIQPWLQEQNTIDDP